MSGQNSKQEKSNEASRTTSLLGARALLSRQLGSNSSPSPGRLPSLRPARDLTLGATPKITLGGTPKRAFSPNIPLRRVKEESKDVPAKDHSEKPKVKGRGRGQNQQGRGSGRGRGRGNWGKSEIVTSASIFSLGPADKQKSGQILSTKGFAGGELKGGDRRSQIVAKKDKNADFDDEESKRILKMLHSGDEDIEDETQDFGMAPVQIPLSNFSQRLKEAGEKAARQIQIKEEPMDVDLVDGEEKKPLKPKLVVPSVAVKAEEAEVTCSSLFSSGLEPGEEKFLFFQFPDKLPIKPCDEDEPMTTEQPDGEGNNNKTDVDPSKLTLKNVSEGYIGKLQILKSGKARLLLGDVSLEVAMGTSCSFLQDLVSVHTDELRSDMTVLGHVNHRLICTPDYEKLLSI